MSKSERIADWLDFGNYDPAQVPRIHCTDAEWAAGMALSERRRQERVAGELAPVGLPYEVRYREGASGWYQWIRTHHLPYAEGQFEALRLRAAVIEARLTQGCTILDSFSRDLIGPCETEMAA